MRKDLNITLKGLVKMQIKPNFAELAREYKKDYRTIKKYYEKEEAIEKGIVIPEKDKTYIIDEYKDIIDSKLNIVGIKATSIFLFLKYEKNYTGSYSTIRNYVREKKKSKGKKASIRITYKPGKSAQVDWKENFKLVNKNGEIFEIQLFLFKLPYSNKRIVKVRLDKKQDTVLTCLIECLQNIGGCPEEIWFDNMTTVADICKRGLKGNLRLNNKFKQFSNDIGFKAILCRPHRPKTKGSVENFAGFIDVLLAYNNEFNTYEDIEKIVDQFNINSNKEISQSHGKMIDDVFKKEKEYLIPLPNNIIVEPYLTDRLTRKVSHESMIVYKNNKYSVPIKYIGEILEVKLINNKIHIYDNTDLICCHDISGDKFNYLKSHQIEILESDLFKNKDIGEIEKFIDNNLSTYDLLY